MKERVGAVQCSGGGGGVVVVKALLLWQVVTCNHQSLDLLCGLSRVGKLKHLPRQSTRRRPGQPGARPRPSLIVLHVITSPLLCHLLTIHRRSHACARPDCPYLLLFCALFGDTHIESVPEEREAFPACSGLYRHHSATDATCAYGHSHYCFLVASISFAWTCSG